MLGVRVCVCALTAIFPSKSLIEKFKTCTLHAISYIYHIWKVIEGIYYINLKLKRETYGWLASAISNESKWHGTKQSKVKQKSNLVIIFAIIMIIIIVDNIKSERTRRAAMKRN